MLNNHQGLQSLIVIQCYSHVMRIYHKMGFMIQRDKHASTWAYQNDF